MSSDNVLHIKGTLKRRKNDIRKSKVMHFLACGIVVAAGAAGIVFAHSQKTVDTYFAKTESLNSGFKELEDKRSELEIAKNDVENQRQELAEEQERILSEAELVAQNNEKLIKENINLQNTLLKAAASGVAPQNYTIPEDSDSAVDYSKLEYVGEFAGTAYTPSPEECSNSLGYTASGKPIVPGVSIAVDSEYWKLGTKFYIEGLGYVVAMDTGSAVKGKYRFDYAVFDKSFALKLGRQKWKVYLVTED